MFLIKICLLRIEIVCRAKRGKIFLKNFLLFECKKVQFRPQNIIWGPRPPPPGSATDKIYKSRKKYEITMQTVHRLIVFVEMSLATLIISVSDFGWLCSWVLKPGWMHYHLQRRIQDFPKGGRQPQRGAANSRGGYVSKNLYVKTKESGPGGGGAGRRRTPGSATDLCLMSLANNDPLIQLWWQAREWTSTLVVFNDFTVTFPNHASWQPPNELLCLI